MKARVTLVALTLSAALAPQALANQDIQLQYKLNKPIAEAFRSLGNTCQDFKADTNNDHSFELSDHHQSFELSHKWSDGSHTAFIAHSETGSGDYGQILAYTMPDSMYNNGDDVINKNTTMPQRNKIRITEQHPSGMAWLPIPITSKRDQGYLFIASENENKVRIRKFSRTSDLGETNTLLQNELSQITDVWLTQRGQYTWLMLHNMNADEGTAYRALTQDLFQIGSHNEGDLDMNALQLMNRYQSPSNSGCDKSVGQNAQLVQDSTNRWYVVHSYTGGTVCGANIGSNNIKAYPAYFNDDGTFTMSTSNSPSATTTLGTATGPTSVGADGASGFRVNNDGRLVAYLGAQYAHSSWFDWKTNLRECRSNKS